MNIALILAAGKGTRVKSSRIPKQFMLINKKPLIAYTLESFQNQPEIDKILLVTNKEYLLTMQEICCKYKIDKLCGIIKGGSTRKESVYNGLMYLKSNKTQDEDIILIHDGARALVSNDIIKDNINSCLKYNAVTTVIPSQDTIISSCKGDTLDATLNREELYQVQTPQTFKFELILKAHENALNLKQNITDDTKLVKLLNKDVHLVLGSTLNFKITTDEDVKIFEFLSKKSNAN